jgi:hypothetical protein
MFEHTICRRQIDNSDLLTGAASSNPRGPWIVLQRCDGALERTGKLERLDLTDGWFVRVGDMPKDDLVVEAASDKAEVLRASWQWDLTNRSNSGSGHLLGSVRFDGKQVAVSLVDGLQREVIQE